MNERRSASVPLELTPSHRTRNGLGKDVLPGRAITQPGMWVNGVVVLHPAIDQSKSRSGIEDRADPDIVALEGLHESPRLCHCSPGFRPG